MAELHPTIADKYRLKKGGFVKFSHPKLGNVDLRVVPLSFIQQYINDIPYLEAIDTQKEVKEDKKKIS